MAGVGNVLLKAAAAISICGPGVETVAAEHTYSWKPYSTGGDATFKPWVPLNQEELPHFMADLGESSWPEISSNSGLARKAFQQGLLSMYSFNFPLAQSRFQACLHADATVAMCTWGLAMSTCHIIWNFEQPAVARDIMKGISVQKVVGEREADFIEFANLLFNQDMPLPRFTFSDRVTRFKRGLAKLQKMAAKYPEDPDVVFFDVMIRIALAGKGRDFVNQFGKESFYEAKTRLDDFSNAWPHHPGMQHVNCHMYDDPTVVKLMHPIGYMYGIDSATGVPHSHHMPSHNMLRTGDWQGMIERNQAAAATSWQIVNFLKLRLYDFDAHNVRFEGYGMLQERNYARFMHVVEGTHFLLSVVEEHDLDEQGVPTDIYRGNTPRELYGQWMRARRIIEEYMNTGYCPPVVHTWSPNCSACTDHRAHGRKKDCSRCYDPNVDRRLQVRAERDTYAAAVFCGSDQQAQTAHRSLSALVAKYHSEPQYISLWDDQNFTNQLVLSLAESTPKLNNAHWDVQRLKDTARREQEAGAPEAELPEPVAPISEVYGLVLAREALKRTQLHDFKCDLRYTESPASALHPMTMQDMVHEALDALKWVSRMHPNRAATIQGLKLAYEAGAHCDAMLESPAKTFAAKFSALPLFPSTDAHCDENYECSNDAFADADVRKVADAVRAITHHRTRRLAQQNDPRMSPPKQPNSAATATLSLARRDPIAPGAVDSSFHLISNLPQVLRDAMLASAHTQPSQDITL